MFCTKCGNRLPDGAQFCNECGGAVKSGADEQKQEWNGQTEQQNRQEQPPIQQYQQPQGYAPQRPPVVSVNVAEIKEKTSEVLRNITGENIGITEDQPEYQRYPHPYHQLGGWLGFVTYAQLVAVGLMTVLFLFSAFLVFKYLRYLGAWSIILLLIEFVGYGITCFFCVKFYTLIKDKNPRFLRFYELTMITLCSIYVLILILPGVQANAESIRSLLSGLLGFFIWTTYFRKSVRVRTYMGSDAYLRYSIFFKNTIAPAPADTEPYVAPQQRSAQAGAPVYSQPNTDYQPAESTARAFCSNCGAELGADAKFCSNCGDKKE